jgi:ubiquinone/menaquinone biosynthesis C-methylase UbiE
MTNYDATDIPAAYDRGRDHGPELLDLWMDAIASHLEEPPGRILDLGCGTGRFSDVLALRFHADVIGLDPSFKMLGQAVQKRRAGRVHYQLGRGEAIPLRSSSLDVIFMSMSLHHFSDPARAAAECRRVLRDRGYVFIRTGTRERIPSYPYYPFFPTSHPLLEEVLPACGTVREIFQVAGLTMIAWDLIRQTIAPDWETYAEKLAAGADSVLARLEREDFDNGIAAVRQHAFLAKAQAVVEPIDLFVFRACRGRQE